MKSLNQCQKVDSLILEIDAVGGQVDSGENDLLVTFLCQDLYFLLGRRLLTRPLVYGMMQ